MHQENANLFLLGRCLPLVNASGLFPYGLWRATAAMSLENRLQLALTDTEQFNTPASLEHDFHRSLSRGGASLCY